MFPFPFLFWDMLQVFCKTCLLCVKFLSPGETRMILLRPALAFPSSDSVFAPVGDYKGLTGAALFLAGFVPTLSPPARSPPLTLLPRVWPCLSGPSAPALGWNGIHDICSLPVCFTQLQDVSLCPLCQHAGSCNSCYTQPPLPRENNSVSCC